MFVIAEQGLPRAKTFPAFRIAMLAGEVGKRQPGQVTPSDQWDVLGHMTTCPVYQVQGRTRALLGVAGHLTAHGKQ